MKLFIALITFFVYLDEKVSCAHEMNSFKLLVDFFVIADKNKKHFKLCIQEKIKVFE